MQSLSQAYGARWSSAFGHRELRYNARLWKPLQEFHSPEDVYFGLVDPVDGSSFLIRIETVDELDALADRDIEAAMAESIAPARFRTRFRRRWTQAFAGVAFNLVEYAFVNEKYGEQCVCHAYARGEGDVTLLTLAWPTGLPCVDDGLPVKHAALLGGLSL